MRSKLKVPLQLADLRVQRDDAVGIEIVAPARVAIVVFARVAGWPVNRIQLWIVGARKPCHRTSVFNALPLPRFRTRLAGPWHGPESPRLFSSGLVIGRQESAHPFFASRRSGDHQISD